MIEEIMDSIALKKPEYLTQRSWDLLWMIEMENRVNRMIRWINEHGQAGGEHDPDRKSKYIRKVRRNVAK